MASSWSPPMVFKLSKTNYTVEWDRKQWSAWGRLISSTICVHDLPSFASFLKSWIVAFGRATTWWQKIPLNAPGARFGSQPVFTGRNRPGRLWELWQQLVWFQKRFDSRLIFAYGDFGKSLKSREGLSFSCCMYICTFSHTWKPQTTSLNWMFGETTISYVKVWNHPIETTIYKWLFGVPGIYIYIQYACQGKRWAAKMVFSALEESTKVGKIKKFLSILLMGFRNPVNSPVEGKVVEIPLFIRFYTSQVVVWGFLPSQQQGRSCILIKESTSNLHPPEVWQTADSSPLKSDRDPKGKRDRPPNHPFSGNVSLNFRGVLSWFSQKVSSFCGGGWLNPSCLRGTNGRVAKAVWLVEDDKTAPPGAAVLRKAMKTVDLWTLVERTSLICKQKPRYRPSLFSRELTYYPLFKALLKMIFQIPWWDTLVP